MQPRREGNAQGIDVSHYQGDINWAKVKADGISFAFLKASQGQTFRDSMFIKNAAGARNAGILVGAYHYIDAASTDAAKKEAANFAAAIADAGGIEAFQLPPVMDYEEIQDGMNVSDVHAVAMAFLTEIERLTGVRPIIYTYIGFASNFDASFSAYDVWMARYSTDPPADTLAWKRWTFLQYSDGTVGDERPGGGKQVDGVAGPVDLNEYDGTEEELEAAYRNDSDDTDEGGDEMTDAEKQQMEDLTNRVAALEKRVNMSGNQTPPAWANDAIVAAKKSGYITTSNDKGHAELVMIQMLYNAGLCNEELVAFFRSFSAETKAAIDALVNGQG
ncbi:lysozyme [Paenibacillus cellulosilyticus]|uniref:Lysozyme n=1 Tax=Paenibacillus cellulosilyticus TaxID=375489 RepID=A0A2V2YTQ5_9BACL|nr:glycoside hydrolase family 25 protein [Paenibacillus cellulosilyticus]PWV99717.1 lysozyme [Paenibacillus cellulosilyticus]QKS44850.1 glycoside hydrolase family 25 protein [Paenibacillus cellulosilyticus]